MPIPQPQGVTLWGQNRRPAGPCCWGLPTRGLGAGMAPRQESSPFLTAQGLFSQGHRGLLPGQFHLGSGLVAKSEGEAGEGPPSLED